MLSTIDQNALVFQPASWAETYRH